MIDPTDSPDSPARRKVLRGSAATKWIFGYKPHYGLCSVDRRSFKRTIKPSAHVLAAIARANAVG